MPANEGAPGSSAFIALEINFYRLNTRYEEGKPETIITK